MQRDFVKQRFPVITAALCTALSGIFFLTGCREDAIIKSSLTPAVDNIHTFGIGPDFNNGTDTITMLTKTVREDSAITSYRNGLPIYHALGKVVDPYAGTTTGSIYMQVVPTTTGFTLAGSTIDSLVLVLPYSGFTWGDTTASYSQSVKAYQITDAGGFSKDSTYYSYSQKTHGTVPIGSGTIQLGRAGMGTIRDSVSVRGINRAPHLRIQLSQDFIDNVFMPAIKADSTYVGFLSVLTGLYIAPDEGPTTPVALPYFRLNGNTDVYGGAAGIVAYAHHPGVNDSLVYQFPYTEANAAHFNNITRSYTGTPADALFDSTVTQEIVMMQNGPGAAIDVKLPYIPNLPKDVIINKAELVFTKVPATSDDRFFGPARLLPQGINNGGVHYTVADRYPVNDASLAFIDGTPQTAVKNGVTLTQYHINLPREVQQAIIDGYAQRPGGLHLRIGGTINYPAAYRVVIGGRGNSNAMYRPSINIIYSKQ